jgi:GT2 family glycosyltransferase
MVPNSAIFSSESYGGWDRSTVRSVDIVSGCLLLIDRTFWRDLKGFDPAFFMYAEEADLCLRAIKHGAQPTVTPTATIVHYGAVSEISRAEKLVKVLKAKVTIMYRHWSPLKRDIGRGLMLMAPLTRWAACSFLAGFAHRQDLKARAREWRKVWTSRADWICGY